jgi:hypothetical protein
MLFETKLDCQNQNVVRALTRYVKHGAAVEPTQREATRAKTVEWRFIEDVATFRVRPQVYDKRREYT